MGWVVHRAPAGGRGGQGARGLLERTLGSPLGQCCCKVVLVWTVLQSSACGEPRPPPPSGFVRSFKCSPTPAASCHFIEASLCKGGHYGGHCSSQIACSLTHTRGGTEPQGNSPTQTQAKRTRMCSAPKCSPTPSTSWRISPGFFKSAVDRCTCGTAAGHMPQGKRGRGESCTIWLQRVEVLWVPTCAGLLPA